jgi:beta-lactamase superfamily II metal-dependent hydrolase
VTGVTDAAVIFEALPAGYGDCLLVTCERPQGPWHLLIDTGPDECWPVLAERLAALPRNAQGQRFIDLAVVSHIDHDHIGGAARLFGDGSLNLAFGDVWFNAPPRPGARGVAEGEGLAMLLGEAGAGLPWNRAWHRQLAVTPSVGFVELPARPDDPRLTLLSPDAASLARLFKVWDRELARMAAKPRSRPAPPAPRAGAPIDLKALAASKTAVDRAPANGSSIALLLEHRGATLLLAADAWPQVLVPALQALAAQRGVALPLPVDVFKLSHHGSRANVTLPLLETVRARQYVFSTNGAIFQHPDDEAVARVITAGGTQPALWFNFRGERTEHWGSDALQAQWHYTAQLPEGDAASVRIGLAGDRA